MTKKVLLEDGSIMGYLAQNSGTIHQTEAEALADENRASYAAKVSAFVASRSWKRGQDTRAESLITEFLAWCDTDQGKEALANPSQPAEPAAEPAVPPAPEPEDEM